ncbi:MAG: polymerase [Planctomycetota bacterium]
MSPPAPDLTGKTVFALDLLSRAYQLFHALPEMTSPDGRPVSVIFGLIRDLLDTLEKRKPDYIFCGMDAPGPTFRHERFEAYKANRAEMPADLVPQIPLVRELLEVMGIPCLERPGFEADDILATLATRVAEAGGDCTIATSDKDARQLLGEHVSLLNLRNNARLGAAELAAEWGIAPDQVVDFLALVGDAVDNVPGVPGIGPKIAGELLQKFGTLEGILANIDRVSGAKRKENLATHADTARAGRELIRLERSVPIEIPWEAGRRHEPDAARLAAFIRDLGFRSLLGRVQAGVPEPRPTRQAATLFDLDGETGDERAEVPATVPLAVPDSAAAADQLAERLRETRPLVVYVSLPPAATPMTPPDAIAVVGDGVGGWFDRQQMAACGPLRDLLADPSIPKWGHDLKRQDVALRTLGIPLGGAAFDTLLAAYLLEAGERNLGLAETCRRHGLGAAVPADVAAFERPAEPGVAAGHAAAVRLLAAELPGRLEEAGLTGLYRDLELPLAGLLADMEVRGVRVDTAVLAALSGEYAARLESLEAEVHALAGHAFALASPVQVRAVLFDELGLPVVKRTKTGPSTDAEVLKELAPLHPLPAKLLEHRKYAKLKSTYVDALPALVDPGTRRIHTTFNQTVAATGRLSSSDPNLQNIPIRTDEGQQIRAAFLPAEDGWRFVAADYSQIELRVLAHLSGDAAMKAAFESGTDIHVKTAAAVHGVESGDVSAEMRRLAKAVNFGILYGQSAFGLAKSLGIPQAEAAAFIAAYLDAFAGASAFMDDLLDRCRRDGFVTTILGRRRAIRGVRERAARRNAAGVPALSLPEREAVNTVVQGSAADLIKLAMLKVAAGLRREGLRAALVLQIHDELLLESPPDELAAVERLVETEMRGAMKLTVPLEVSVETGGTWAECG